MAEAAKPANEDVPTTASGWLVALCEKPGSRELHVHFERWLAANPAHVRDWEEIAHAADLVRAVPPSYDHEWGEFLRRRQAARTLGGAAPPVKEAISPPPLRRRLLARVVAVAAAACLALLVADGLLPRLAADHATASAERRSVTLADGTRVLLAPESAIDVAYTSEARQVRLIRGAAFFEVADESSRPFGVSAGGLSVRDIGTSFEVRLDEQGTGVAVREGVVDVTASRSSGVVAERLEAGDWLRVTRTGPHQRGRTAADEVAAWTQGQLIVKNRPVAEVVDALRPYFGGLVILRGTSLGKQPLTGVYNLADPIDALRAVARAQGASLFQLSPWLVVISGD
jgi:transmembrane sensor